MAKKSKSMIGHDPLAWLKDDVEKAEVIEEVKPAKKAKKKSAKKVPAKAKAKKDEATKEDNVFKLQSTQDISSVAELHKELKSLFKHEKVVFDASEVERIDTSSLQLLYAFTREAKVNDVEVTWRSPSDAMKKSAGLLGMEEVLQL